ncbi:unnamed protein product [Medioppia subpectinata]|uniref:Uncharacterized protein n=1 Tax=Medioppia subpectinata TaxID=1979941 RepID=A0A7R9Q0H5_9ACAR|nr:unnamed protein product [Medioppia subpectinata]CAG2107556.1 unnamed protein product [Medioppia subpectinata]
MCCENEKCCFDKRAAPEQIQCFYGLVGSGDKNKMPHYTVKQVDKVTATLKPAIASMPRYLQKPDPKADPKDGPIIFPELDLQITYFKNEYFVIEIKPTKDNETEDYQIPTGLKKFDKNETIHSSSKPSDAEITLVSTTKANCKDCFMLSVKRRNGSQIIFNTGDFTPFLYSRGLIEITTLLPNEYIYGLGQSPSRSFKHNMSYPEVCQYLYT